MFAHVSRRFQTPDVSILFYGGAAILFSLWAGFAALAVASTLSRLVMYLLVRPGPAGVAAPGRCECAVVAPACCAILAAISTLWVASHASAEAFQMLGLIFAVGTGLYFIAARQEP